MRAIERVDVRAAHQLQIRLVHERGGLQRSRLILAPQLFPRHLAQVIVHEREHPIERAPPVVALPELAKQQRDFAWGFAHARGGRAPSAASAALACAARRGWSTVCFCNVSFAARSSGSASALRPSASRALAYVSWACPVRPFS